MLWMMTVYWDGKKNCEIITPWSLLTLNSCIPLSLYPSCIPIEQRKMFLLHYLIERFLWLIFLKSVNLRTVFQTSKIRFLISIMTTSIKLLSIQLTCCFADSIQLSSALAGTEKLIIQTIQDSSGPLTFVKVISSHWGEHGTQWPHRVSSRLFCSYQGWYDTHCLSLGLTGYHRDSSAFIGTHQLSLGLVHQFSSGRVWHL